MRSVDPQHRAARHTPSDLGRDLAVTAAEVEDAFVNLEPHVAEALLRQPLLKCRDPAVGWCVPFGHGRLRIRCSARCVLGARARRPEANHAGEARPMTTTSHRGLILGSLLVVAIAAPGHALVKKVPIAPGSSQLVPYSPPYTPPQPPMQPGSPVITQRTPFSI